MEPIVFVPGTLCNKNLWEAQEQFFSKYTTIEFADITQDDSVPNMVGRLLEKAPPKFILVGLSLGGIVSLEVMRQAPERVNKLILMDSTPYLPRAEQQEAWDSQIRQVENGQFSEVIEQDIFPGMFYCLEKRKLETLKQMAIDVGEKSFLNQVLANKNRPNGMEILSTIKCPTLILSGRQDILCKPETQIEMNKKIADSQLSFIEACGHLSSLEKPQEVNKAIFSFLQNS